MNQQIEVFDSEIQDQLLTTFNRLLGTGTSDLREVAAYAAERARHIASSRAATDFNKILEDEANNVKSFGSDKLVDLADASDEAVTSVVLSALDWASRFISRAAIVV